MLKNKKINILFVFGTRAEAIKLASVIKEFQKDNKHFETRICVTTKYLYELIGKVLLRAEDIFKFYKVDLAFAQGYSTYGNSEISKRIVNLIKKAMGLE